MKLTFRNVVKPWMPRKGQGLVLSCFSWTVTLEPIVPTGPRTKRVPTAGPTSKILLMMSFRHFSSSCYFNNSSLSKEKGTITIVLDKSSQIQEIKAIS